MKALFVLLLFLPFAAAGQRSQFQKKIQSGDEKNYNAPNDSSHITKKSFSPVVLDQLRTDQELNYQQPPTVVESLWDRIKRWLNEFIDKLFEGATTEGVGRILIYTFGVIVLVVIILTLLKVNAFKILYSGSDQNRINYQVLDENIHAMDFDRLIREATQRQDFRLATRLILLYALKMLSDKHFIQWQAGKTNHDYVNELTATELKAGLNELSFYFDYAWYGNFPIAADTFTKIETHFAQWQKILATK